MLKSILIISPHYPPSNLAAVHRSRLFAQHLPALGWNPIILTVDEDYYDTNLSNLNLYLVKAIQELKSENDTLKEILQRNNIQ